MELFKCDVCCENTPVRLEMLNKYNNNQDISVCGNCGFVYVPYRRSSKQIADSWNDDLFQKSYTAMIPYIQARITYALRHLIDNVGIEGKSICDIGAGEGLFLDFCKRDSKNVDLYGIEPSPHNIDIMKKNNHDCYLGTIEEYRESSEFHKRKFDIVTIMWTVEACLDCKHMTQIAHDMLKEDGILLISTGSRILVPYKKPLSSYVGPNPVDTHCFRFSANSITNLLTVCGFENESLNRYTDGEFMIAIGKKNTKNLKTNTSLKKDDPKLVYEFFERWDKETEWFKENDLI